MYSYAKKNSPISYRMVTSAAGSTSASDAVHVVVEIPRQVEVEHMSHVNYVETARRHVGPDEDPRSTGAEVGESALAVLLFAIAVDAVASDAAHREVGGEVVGDRLRTMSNNVRVLYRTVQSV